MNPNILYNTSMEDDVIFDQAHFELLHSETSNGHTSGSSTNPQTPVVSNRRSKSRNLGRLLRTTALCASYFGLGLCMAITGPTLPNLQAQVEASVSQISYIFTARSIGTLTGSFAGGVLFDRYNRYSLLFLVVLCMAIGIGSMPWCRRLWLLMCSSVFIGIGGGFLDTGASVLCLELWGNDAGPYMQALHFFFGLGGFVAPLLAQPFLGGGIPSTDIGLNYTGRHVRSTPEFTAAALAFNNHSDPVNFTLPASMNITASENISTAATTPPLLSEVTTLTPANITVKFGNSSGNGTSLATVPPAAENATLADSSDNSTEAATKGPTPKPKPQFINGSVLGNSEKWEKTPLQQVPAPDEKPPPTTLAPTTPQGALENATSAASATVSSTVAAGNSSSSDSAIVAANATTAAPVLLLNSSSFEPIVNSTSAPELANHSDSTGDPISNYSTPADNYSTSSSPVLEKTENPPIPSTTVATPTTTAASVTFRNVTDKLVIPVSPSVGSTEIPVTTLVPLEGSEEKLPVPVRNDDADNKTLPVASTAATWTPKEEVEDSVQDGTTPSGELVTKSRGKSRGQQEEHADVITTTMTTTVATTTTTDAVTHSSSPTRHKPVTYTNGSEDEYKPGAKIDVDWEKYGVTRIHLLYSIIAIIVVHIAFSFLFFLCPSERERTAAAVAARAAAGSKPRRKNLFVTLLCLVYLIYVGMEVSYSQFLTTFGMKSDLQLPEESANYVTAILWGSFALTRLAAIFFASFLNPTYMLAGNFLLCFVGSILLCISGQSSQLILSIGSAMMGIGMASTFATGFVWTEKRLAVTNRIASAFSICSALGEMISPAITGALLEHQAMSLMYYTFASNCACILLLGGAWYLGRKRRGFLDGDIFAENEYQLAKQVEDEHELN